CRFLKFCHQCLWIDQPQLHIYSTIAIQKKLLRNKMIKNSCHVMIVSVSLKLLSINVQYLNIFVKV
ncbi:hypothetical protein DOY81_014935, partial [Sarcophaga bullata]